MVWATAVFHLLPMDSRLEQIPVIEVFKIKSATF
jgi:hypothetical protein